MLRMSCRRRSFSACLALVVLGCAWPRTTAAQPAAALESPAPVAASLTAMLARAEPFGSLTPPRVGLVPVGTRLAADHSERRPPALPGLYVSFAVLQGLDVHSTLAAVDAGRREANPLVRELTSRPGGMIAAKIGATAGTLFLTERLWRKHRVAAVALMVGVNVAYAMVVANNYRARPRS